jgi:hypothetical protein
MSRVIQNIAAITLLMAVTAALLFVAICLMERSRY